MKTVNIHAQVDMELCKGCMTCEKVCPVFAVKVKKEDGRLKVDINEDICVGCMNCEQRCPEQAISMKPCSPYDLATDVSQFDYEQIKDLCRRAHFHPKQVVCYCTATRAEEVAAAILAGAKTPPELVLATGVNAGCGIECNQTIMRFLNAAGITYERPKLSYQWYGRTITAWEVPESLKQAQPVFRFDGDLEIFDSVVNAPIRSERPEKED